LASHQIREQFVKKYGTKNRSELAELRSALASIQYKIPLRGTDPFVVDVNMTTILSGNDSTRLFSDYLAFLDYETRRELVAAVEKRRRVSVLNSGEVIEPFTVDDLQVMKIDRPPIPPHDPVYPNRKLVITAALLLGLFLGTLLSTIAYVRVHT
jgi:hypothetical protein